MRRRRWWSCGSQVVSFCFPRGQGVQLASRFALVVHVVDENSALLFFGVKTFALRQGNTARPFRVDRAVHTKWRMIAFLHSQRVRQQNALAVVAICVKVNLIAILRNSTVVDCRRVGFGVEDLDPDAVPDGGIRVQCDQYKSRYKSCVDRPPTTHQQLLRYFPCPKWDLLTIRRIKRPLVKTASRATL